jgi:hypothetical protein
VGAGEGDAIGQISRKGLGDALETTIALVGTLNRPASPPQDPGKRGPVANLE